MSSQSHSYYEWQVSTLMLAYDVVDPIPRDADKQIAGRQQKVEEEIHAMAMKLIPQTYRDNPQMEFPPAITMLLTKATIARASEILGMNVV
ncbi:MAG: hypothetical protein H7144_17745 [Burkholderiales bacterium]|nr:hypothetical protein [Phycisphaerae bacterium]